MPTSSCAIPSPDRNAPTHVRVCQRLILALAFFAVVSTPAAAFDLSQYRLRAATDRAAGLAEGWQVLDAGVFENDPAGERLLLWYMGAAAAGASEHEALDAIIARLDRLGQKHGDDVARSYAGFLRGARQIDAGDARAGLVMVLESANRMLAVGDPIGRIAAAGELCSAYTAADLPQSAIEHCKRYRRLAESSGDTAYMARADYLEASALSRSARPKQAVERWQSARRRFLDMGQNGLAARTAGSMANDLVVVGRYAEALEMADESLAAAIAVSSAISVAISRGVRADALIGLGRYDEAQAELDLAMALAASMDQPFLQGDLLQSQANLLEKRKGDPARVRALRARAADLRDTGMYAEGGQELQSLELQFREREQQLRIRELEAEQRTQDLALQQARLDADRSQSRLDRQRLVMWAVGTLSLLLAAGLVVLLRLLRAQRRLAEVLRTQAYRDALTGIPNRRALNEVAGALLAESAHEARGHVLMMADLDHFKAINDRHGHPFGDQVLATVAALLQALVPPTALVVRMGGEEFALLCPDLGREAALALAASIRQEVAALALESRGESVVVTISIGVAVHSSDTQDFSTWLRAADAALYRAKAAGRNRVVLADG